MSVKFQCDGCEVVSQPAQKFHERGLIKKKHYCDTCVSTVDAFLEERRANQIKAAEYFQKLQEKSTKKFKEKLCDGQFPDE